MIVRAVVLALFALAVIVVQGASLEPRGADIALAQDIAQGQGALISGR